MSNFIGKEIDARQVLSKWYGVDSTVCDTFRQVSETKAQGEFVVGENFCGVLARPPMFDNLRLNDGVFRTQTSADDAKEHFIESVGISLVPAHNLLGLVIEALLIQKGRGRLYDISLDFIRFGKTNPPGEEIAFFGSATDTEEGFSSSFTVEGQRRPFVKNLKIKDGRDLGEGVGILDQHWLLEVVAQAGGLVALAQEREDIAPVLIETGASKFSNVPIFAGDSLTSYLTILMSDEQQVLLNAQVRKKEEPVAEINDLLLQFMPMSQIRQTIVGARR